MTYTNTVQQQFSKICSSTASFVFVGVFTTLLFPKPSRAKGADFGPPPRSRLAALGRAWLSVTVASMLVKQSSNSLHNLFAKRTPCIKLHKNLRRKQKQRKNWIKQRQTTEHNQKLHEKKLKNFLTFLKGCNPSTYASQRSHQIVVRALVPLRGD